MRINKFHGNISILVLFVLLASALMGTFVALFMKGFFQYNTEIYAYERASGLTKAGEELGMSIAGLRGIGFDYHLQNTGQFLTNNFSGAQHLQLALSLSGLTSIINASWGEHEDCEEPYYLKIGAGKSKILPLFVQNSFSSLQEGFEAPSYSSISSLGVLRLSPDQDWNFSLVGEERNDEIVSEEWIGALGNKIIGNTITYLIIANTSSTPKNLCIHSEENLAQEKIKIQSIGSYKDKSIGKINIFELALPSFMQENPYTFS